MRRTSWVVTVLSVSLVVTSCGSGSTPDGASAAAALPPPDANGPVVAGFEQAAFGAYVSDSYAGRADGADWVGVELTPLNAQRVRVAVRSRGDKKRPTCTLHALASVADASTLEARDNNIGITIAVSGGQLTIAATDPAAQESLHFFCSGGATIAGTYSRIDDGLDSAQVDPRTYSKTLVAGELRFFLDVVGRELTIRPIGLEFGEPSVTELRGEAYDAEIGDITGDNFPEVAVYAVDEGGRGSLRLFSVLAGRSMVEVNVPDLAANAEASEGYTGGDEFAMVENRLARRFPIPGGKTRQIQYRIVPGEAMPQLQVDRITEY